MQTIQSTPKSTRRGCDQNRKPDHRSAPCYQWSMCAKIMPPPAYKLQCWILLPKYRHVALLERPEVPETVTDRTEVQCEHQDFLDWQMDTSCELPGNWKTIRLLSAYLTGWPRYSKETSYTHILYMCAILYICLYLHLKHYNKYAFYSYTSVFYLFFPLVILSKLNKLEWLVWIE